MESGEHARAVLALIVNQAHKLLCMQAMVLCAQTYILVKLGLLR